MKEEKTALVAKAKSIRTVALASATAPAGIYDTLLPLLVKSLVSGTGRYGFVFGAMVTSWRIVCTDILDFLPLGMDQQSPLNPKANFSKLTHKCLLSLNDS